VQLQRPPARIQFQACPVPAIMKMVKSVFFSFLLNQAGNGRSGGNSDHSIASAGGPILV
jgi:hypothetical protein